MFIVAIKIIGLGILASGLLLALIYCLANLIWGALTWEDDG